MNSTKDAIAASLKQLMAKKSINHITVGEIAEAAGVSRMTFYYHFEDIYDLVAWMIDEETSRAFAENRTVYTWQQGFVSLLEAVRDNSDLILNVYRSASREQLEIYINRLAGRMLTDIIDEQARGLNLSEETKRYVASYYTFAFVGVIMEWLRSGMKTELRTVVDIAGRAIRGEFISDIESMSAADNAAPDK